MIGVGAYNERLVLSLIRGAGALSKSELARATKLSAQTLTTLVDRLEAEHLVVRNEPQRGRVGQPSVPYSLNPEGAYTLGLKVGRRSFELVLINFTGAVVKVFRHTYDYPTPGRLMKFFLNSLDALRADPAACCRSAAASRWWGARPDRKSTRLNSSHFVPSRMPSSA